MEGQVVPTGLCVRQTGGTRGGHQLHQVVSTVQGDVVDTQVPVVITRMCPVEARREEGGGGTQGVGQQGLVMLSSMTETASECVLIGTTVVNYPPSEAFHGAAKEERGSEQASRCCYISMGVYTYGVEMPVLTFAGPVADSHHKDPPQGRNAPSMASSSCHSQQTSG